MDDFKGYEPFKRDPSMSELRPDLVPGSSRIPVESDGTVNLRLPYVALPYQKEIGRDQHRFVTIVASRRVGKTIYAINKLLKWALTRDVPEGTAFWYVAPYYHQAKTIAWMLLLRYVPQQLWARKPNESSLTMYLTNGRTIVLKGADNPLALEGTALGGLVVDEVSLMTHWEQLWNYSLRPMLADYTAPAVFISKPRGFNHFHDLAKMGDHNNIIEGQPRPGIKLNKDYITYRFKTEINCRDHNGGYIDHSEIEAARESLPPEAFAQEWEGRFTRYTGLVHKDFDRATHVIDNMELPKEWRRWRGWDFGSTHPTATLRFAIDPDDNWWVETCDKESDITISTFAEQIRKKDALWCNMDGADTIPGYGDPSGKQWIKEFNKEKVSIRRAVKSENTSEQSWLQFGIDKINEKIKTREKHIVFLPDHEGTKIENAPSFFILNRPENFMLISELETLAYKVTAQGSINKAEIDDTTDKEGHYDLEAALRYIAVSIGRRLAFEKLSQVAENPEYYQSQQTMVQLRPPYQASTVNMDDPAERRRLELEADLEAIRQQTSN